jgi:GntR family transcriptional regulator
MIDDVDMKKNKSLNVKNSALPLYSRVESTIRNRIMNRQLMPGDMLPKEQDLAALFNVSQITIRTALSHLKEAGLIVRSRAKGTFVAEDIPEKTHQFLDMNDVYSLVRDASNYQVKSVEILPTTVKNSRYPQDLMAFFEISLDDPIAVVRRVRMIDRKPVVLLENNMPTDIAKNLDEKALMNKSLLKTLKEKIGLSMGRGEFYVEAIPAEPDIAEFLMTELLEPIISVKVYFWFPDGKPFEIVNCFTRADYFKYKGSISADHFKEV